MMRFSNLFVLFAFFNRANAYSTQPSASGNNHKSVNSSRRAFLQTASTLTIASTLSTTIKPDEAEAIGPVKLVLDVKDYSARICPPDRPIPGEKAMKGMRGLCVTVKADLVDQSPKDLEKVGVYGFVVDAKTGDSVLANNPDLSTDAGQFAMIETITPKTNSVEFEFIAAVPMEKDLTKYENGIGELGFEGLRVVSFPGGQQYGAVSPCEMNEFSVECEEWEEENGPYVKGNFMMKSNTRTKGR